MGSPLWRFALEPTLCLRRLRAKLATRLPVSSSKAHGGSGTSPSSAATATVTVNDRVTAAAAEKLPLPAWLATRVQVPVVNKLMVDALTLHTLGVNDVSVTAKPELAVAAGVKGGAPNSWLANALKLMVCGAKLMLKMRCTWGAAANVALPA